MAQPFLGEIEFFAFSFPPKNWMFCAGQVLAVQQNQALFSLLGVTYGGDGIHTFMLPDLRGRVPMGQGNGAGLQPRVLGQAAGEETHVLVTGELPTHTHQLSAVADASVAVTTTPGGHLPAVGQDKTGGNVNPINYFIARVPDVAMAPTAIGPSSGAASHDNMMPYLALNACIAIGGVYPSRN